MRITIINEPEMHDAVSAWRLSRDKDAEYAVDKIAGVDAPVMEMPSGVFNFELFTILEREIFCSLRNHVVWARTSRVDDPRLFTVPEEFKSAIHDSYRNRMIEEAESGARQDDWRMMMPLVAHTAWTQRLSLRDLARLAVYFNYLGKKAKFRPLKGRFGAISYQLTRLITELLGGRTAHALLDKQPVIRFLYESRIDRQEGLEESGYFKVVNCAVPLGLRAQIIRHREIQFIDDYWCMINNDVDLLLLQLKNKVMMQLCARGDVWQAVASKRACWIAQSDLWTPLLKQFGFHVPLPCVPSGHCPYQTDALARLEGGKDPNPPCPKFCNLYKVPKEPYKAEMMKEAFRRGKFWIEQVEL